MSRIEGESRRCSIEGIFLLQVLMKNTSIQQDIAQALVPSES